MTGGPATPDGTTNRELFTPDYRPGSIGGGGKDVLPGVRGSRAPTSVIIRGLKGALMDMTGDTYLSFFCINPMRLPPPLLSTSLSTPPTLWEHHHERWQKLHVCVWWGGGGL